jgi:hypothetical protein
MVTKKFDKKIIEIFVDIVAVDNAISRQLSSVFVILIIGSSPAIPIEKGSLKNIIVTFSYNLEENGT